MFRVPERAELAGPAVEVAPWLLGALLISTSDAGTVGVRLTEVEAYQGERDPGSHAFRGRSARTESMFGEAGHLYAYRHLGLHTCVNVVCGTVGGASAVLLRAGEVVRGTALARARRTARGVSRSDTDLARGPARLTVALGLGQDCDGLDVLADGSRVRLQLPVGRIDAARIRTGPRVGVSGAGGDGDLFPWRFWIEGEPTVSEYRRAAPSKRRGAAESVRASVDVRETRSGNGRRS